jgi:hypothetical protein
MAFSPGVQIWAMLETTTEHPTQLETKKDKRFVENLWYYVLSSVYASDISNPLLQTGHLAKYPYAYPRENAMGGWVLGTRPARV